MELERYQHAGLTIIVGVMDYDREDFNPRQYDNLGTMVCWHPSYALGDMQITNGEGRGYVIESYDRNDFTSMRQLARWIGIAKQGVCIMPLYLYEHSGISISVGQPNPFDNPRGPNGLGWDTSMVGFIYTTQERVTELCGDGEQYHALDWIREQLREEVSLYDEYLQGMVYEYSIEDAEGNVLDSCCGFLGGSEIDGRKLDGFEYCKHEAEQAADALAAVPNYSI